MSDVFISYAREDTARAADIHRMLSEIGVSVFLDQKSIPAGSSFPEIIDRELKSAKAVVALWSPHSLTRPWVKQECMVGIEAGVLIPVIIKPLDRRKDLPVNFVDIQSIDFEGFDGTRSHPGWPRLVDAVASALQRPDVIEEDARRRPAADSEPPRVYAPRRKTRWLPIAAAAAAVGVVGLAAAGYMLRGSLFQAIPAGAEEPPGAVEVAGPEVTPFIDNLPPIRLAETFAKASSVAVNLRVCGNRDAATCRDKAAEPDGHVAIFAGSVIRLQVQSPVTGRLLVLNRLKNGAVEIVSPRHDIENAPLGGQFIESGKSHLVPAETYAMAVELFIDPPGAAKEVGQFVFVVVPQLDVLDFNVETLVEQDLLAPEEVSTYQTTVAGVDRLIQRVKNDAARYAPDWGYGTLTYELEEVP